MARNPETGVLDEGFRVVTAAFLLERFTIRGAMSSDALGVVGSRSCVSVVNGFGRMESEVLPSWLSELISPFGLDHAYGIP